MTALPVSILVVVDWVQRLGAAARITFAVNGFNPCCRGLGSKTRHVQNTHGARHSFNPCCRGLGSKTRSRVRAFARQCRGFQSLLSWIGFKDFTHSVIVSNDPASFNPCCRGLGSKTLRIAERRNGNADVSILVVVDWVQRLRDIARHWLTPG